MNLDSLRRHLGPAPRSLRWSLPSPPSWAIKDPIHHIWDTQEQVMRDGYLVYGKIYMANSSLFEPGDNDAPAGVVYSFDSTFERHPEWLEPVGDQVYALHDEENSEPAARPWRRLIQDQVLTGFERPFHQRLPPEMTGGPIVYHNTLMVFRDHLLQPVLESMLLPILVDRRQNGAALIVPPSLYG